MMDTKRGGMGDSRQDDHDNIELQPTTMANKGRYSQPGLEVVPYSNLEVAAPRPGLSHTRTWEKDSHLPQLAGPDNSEFGVPNSPYTVIPGTPRTPYSQTAPSYEYGEYVDHGGEGGGGGGGGGFAAGAGAPLKDGGIFRKDTICGVKRQMFWIIMAVGCFVVVAAVATGVGLGVALHKNGDGVSTPRSVSVSLEKSWSITAEKLTFAE